MLAGDLLLIVIGHRRPIVDAAEAVDRAGIKQQRGDELRLARTAVADDGDVTNCRGVIDLHERVLRSYQLPASSSQLLSACASFLQLLHQANQHAPDLFQLPRECSVQVHGQKLEVAGKKEIILKFVAGTQGMPEEPPEVWV